MKVLCGICTLGGRVRHAKRAEAEVFLKCLFLLIVRYEMVEVACLAGAKADLIQLPLP